MTGKATAAADPLPAQTASVHGARVLRTGLLMASDATALVGAGALAYLTWAQPVHGQGPEMYVELLPLVLLFILGYAQMGLYRRFGLGPVETLRRISYVTFFGFLGLAALSFAVKLPQVYSRATFGLAYLYAAVAVPLVRLVLIYGLRRWRWWQEPVVIVGTGPSARQAIDSLSHSLHLGCHPIAIMRSHGENTSAQEIDGVPVIGAVERSAELSSRGIQVALVEGQPGTPGQLDELHQHFKHVVLLRELDDSPVEGVVVRNLGGILGIEYTNRLLAMHSRVTKRLTDLVLGTGALLMALPVIALAALFVKLISPGPAFYSQERTGRGGRSLRVPKIRTMLPDAERLLQSHLAADPELARQWSEQRKLRDDPRLIPGIGSLLRRWSIDELPQLWSVVIGQMSLVGPRPLPAYHLASFPERFQELRKRVRPGLTGMWQVAVRGDGGLAAQESYDTYYIRNWSLWLDIYILARTASVVLSGRGAY